VFRLSRETEENPNIIGHRTVVAAGVAIRRKVPQRRVIQKNNAEWVKRGKPCEIQVQIG